MDNKKINKAIRQISNHSSLPILWYLILSELLILGSSLIFNLADETSAAYDKGLGYFVLYIFIYIVIFPVIFLLFYKLRGKKTNQTLKSCFKIPEKSAGWIIRWIIISLGITYLISALSNLIFSVLEYFGIRLNLIEMDFGNSTFGIITTIIVLPVLAPIFEELLFRGTIYRNTEPIGQWFAIIITGIMFGLWHANCAQTLYTMTLGIMAGFLIAKTRSIFPSIILHFVFNIIATIQSLCMMNIDIEKIEAEDINYVANNIVPFLIISISVLLVTGLVIAGLVLFIIEIVKHKGKIFTSLNKGEYDIKPLKKAAVYFSAPITIIVFALLVIQTALNALFV